MAKRKVIISIITLVLSLVVVGSVVYAWLTPFLNVAKGDISSGGISMTYIINEEEDFNVETYTIKDVVFFDVDRGKNYVMIKANGTYNASISYYQFAEAGEEDTKYNLSNSYTNASGYYLSGGTYYSYDAGTDTYSLVDTSSFSVGVTPVNNYYVVDEYIFDEAVDGTYAISEVDTSAFNEDTSVSDYYIVKQSKMGESKYLTISAVCIKLDVTNANNESVSVTISADNETNETQYITCFITEEEVSSSSTNTSVNAYLTENSYTNEVTKSNIAHGATASFYIYVYGVQENDSSSNDFLDDTYSFEFSIEAVKEN
ncbi:MAG: hypothetical protein K6E74_03200 [Bacilli bacterium]|nr:hypothetical protein [Bacilli bacterium]